MVQNSGPYYKKNLLTGEKNGLGGGITEFFKNTKFLATDGASFSSDGKTMVFAGAKLYNQDMDFYISYFSGEEWSYPKKLWISTPQNDRSCFISFNEKHIVFASNGYHDRDDLDIYYADLKNSSRVYHLNGEINSSKDDFGFMLPINSKTGVFVRDGNIHEFKLENSKTELVTNLKKDTVNVFFSFGESNLNEKTVLSFLNQLPSSEQIKYIRISGHTDLVGSAKNNFILAEKRNKTILEVLNQYGIPKTLIRTHVLGESQPVIDSNKPEAKNRRCELVIYY